MESERLNIIISILVIIVLLGVIFGYNFFGIRTTINKGVDTLKGLSLNSNEKVECPGGIIPPQFDLLEYEGGLWGYEEWGRDQIYYYWSPRWLDGQEITLYPPTPEGGIDDYSRKYCEKGSEEGQNINYYYCKVGYSKTSTEISNSGEIGETRTESYLIQLSLEKKEHLKNIKDLPLYRYSVISSTCLLN